MNKCDRKIIAAKIGLVRKMASQIVPFEKDVNWIKAYYAKYLVTPMQMAHEVKGLKQSKLHMYG